MPPGHTPEPQPISGVAHLTQGAAFRVMDLHLLNVGAAPRLKEQLQELLASDVRVLAELLEHYRLTTDERTRVQRLLTLIAVQNENHPNAQLAADERVRAILNTALIVDPEYTAKVRARDWTKPAW